MNLQAIAQFAELGDYTFAFALRAIAAAGIADHLGDGPRHIDDLAERTRCDRTSLIRVLRTLATKAVFIEKPAETFALTPVGELLRTDHPLSMRWFFRLEPDVRALAALEHSVRTGQPAFEHVFGTDYFTWMASADQERWRFRESQRSICRLEFLTLQRAFPWKDATSIVDIGGSDGSLVALLLKRFPHMKAIVFDLPETVGYANEVFDDTGVADRASIVRGNVFKGGVPAGADVYLMKRILVGFSDDEVILALTKVQEAMALHSRLLIMEPLQNAADWLGVSLDLVVLALGLGRVRTADEFSTLLSAAGLRATTIRPAGLVTILEAERIGG
jgi:hypothetical protein